jgi:hypothetical protein
MEEELEVLIVALRVLAAFTERRAPEEADVQVLRSHAFRCNGRPTDELAREVIHRVLRARGRDFGPRIGDGFEAELPDRSNRSAKI